MGLSRVGWYTGSGICSIHYYSATELAPYLNSPYHASPVGHHFKIHICCPDNRLPEPPSIQRACMVLSADQPPSL